MLGVTWNNDGSDPCTYQGTRYKHYPLTLTLSLHYFVEKTKNIFLFFPIVDFLLDFDFFAGLDALAQTFPVWDSSLQGGHEDADSHPEGGKQATPLL